MNDEPDRAVPREADRADAAVASGDASAPSPGSSDSAPAKRRRHRGGRGRGRGTGGTGAASGGTATAGADGAAPSATQGSEATESSSGSEDARPRASRTGGSRAPRRRPARQAPAGDGDSPAKESEGRAREAGRTPARGTGEAQAAEPDGQGAAEGGPAAGSPAKRKRRRGSRGRGRGRGPSAQAGGADGQDDGTAPASGEPDDDDAVAGRRASPKASATATRRPAAASAVTDADAGEPPASQAEGSDEEAGTPASGGARKRRRRRRRPGPGTAGASAEATAEAAESGRGRPAGAGGDDGEAAAGAATAPARSPRKSATGSPRQATATRTARRGRTRGGAAASGDGGPTRVRRSRATLRRREPMPVAPRGQDKLMLITEHGERDQIAVVEDRQLVEHYITRVGARSMVGNIYLGRVQNVLPGMEAAFIDIGKGRNAVLYAGEVSYDEDIGGRQQRIEQVLKPGQAALVQVTKDPIGGKGPRLTQEISLPGRYLVLVPNSEVFGISRRLPDNERRRLRAAIKKVRPEPHGVIVRTAAEGASEEDLAADVARLVQEWDAIAKRSKKVKAPHVLYEEPELTVRVVRDQFNVEEFREIVTDSQRVYDLGREYLTVVAPDLVDKVRMHDGKLPLFEQYHLIEQIHKALERKVWLPSGGYIVIDKTEAMTVIDVNTGKHVGKANLEETVTKTNLEAAEEVARQLRLRDIGGMILIDFIDMLLEQNRREVIDTLNNAMAKDKTRSQVFDISPLGILEVTRKRVSAGLLESFSETCPTCGGRGILLTHQI